jgi:hypothetical protein
MFYHVSEEPNIECFVPRLPRHSEGGSVEPIVWAIDEQHLHNYLLPRDCPRVTFYALPSSAPADVERLLAGTAARYVVAIEARWLPAVQRTRLYRYDLPPDTFEVCDAGAGYYVSREAVVPQGVTPITDALIELTHRDVELRVTPSLWPLHDAVAASTLQFSIIRMRNVAPRPRTRAAP